MKKILTLAIMFIALFSLFGCVDTIRTYDGKKISKISYESVDYNGGYTEIFLIDFEDNKVWKKATFPDYTAEQKQNNQFSLKNEFTDEEEQTFINEIYSYGLFDIKQNYYQSGIVDGGGWTLEITYANGSTKVSKGSNSKPTKVFDKCAIPFYKICKEQVLGQIPSSYFSSDTDDSDK